MSLLDAFKKIRNDSLDLAAPLQKEDFVAQPVEFVSPPKWNLAHTTWFFEEFILKIFIPDYQEFHPEYSYMFNSYYVQTGSRLSRGHRGILTRPTIEEVLDYRKFVDERMVQLLETEKNRKFQELLILGLNHEQQHQELFLTDIKYILGTQPLFPYYKADFMEQPSELTTSDKWIEMEKGLYEIGYEGEGFHFDNEEKKHKVYLNDYAISGSLVTNAEYLEFIEDGGYKKPQFWHSEGLSWLEKEKANAPLYWFFLEGQWQTYTLSGLKSPGLSAPVTHINYYEAFAFAQWKGLRLPTEFEWEAAADKFSWGIRWEWTESAYLPYPGYKKPEGAIGEYNGKFMVNQKVLRGSSVATPSGHGRKTYRNFFHPDKAWQFTGIRLAK